MENEGNREGQLTFQGREAFRDAMLTIAEAGADIRETFAL